MAKKTMNKEELSRVYGEVSEDSGKFREIIEKNALSEDAVDMLLGDYFKKLETYPEMASVDKMTGKEFSKFYKKMSDEIKASPGEYEAHASNIGMSAEQLSNLFGQISGGVEQYPEIWESQENAQLLNPKNLMLLVTALKENTTEAITRIKGVERK